MVKKYVKRPLIPGVFLHIGCCLWEYLLMFMILLAERDDVSLCVSLLRCRKTFSEEKGKLEEMELSKALPEIAAEHNSIIQTNAAVNKA